MADSNWFDLGAEAFARFSGRERLGYVCPLCGRLFTAESADQLSVEHAPPRSVGGRPVALTCRDCNSAAGSTVDRHLRSHENVLDFLARTAVRPVEGLLDIGGYVQRVEIRNSGDSLLVFGIPKANSPRTTEGVMAEMNRLTDESAWDGYEFRLTVVERYRRRDASLGWLRAAFLVAFASLGYRYAFDWRLRPVREQLADPSIEVVRDFSFTIPDAPSSERKLLLVERPAWLSSLCVQMGRHLVFLPWPDGQRSIFERLSENRPDDDRLNVKIGGRLIPWPVRPTHQLDFALPSVGS